MSISSTNDFEQARQRRETKNEQVIHLILACVFLMSALAQSSAYLVERAPKQPWALIVTEIVLALLCGGVSLLLGSIEEYRWWRKYVLITFDLLTFALIGATASSIGEPEFNLMMAMVSFMLLIILSGLRYSTRAVLLTGTIVIASNIFLAVRSGLTIKNMVIMSGTLFLAAVTVTVAYVVHSLIKLHDQSVSKQRLRRFFPPEVVNRIETAQNITLDAVETDVTIIFSDISDFTKMTSSMDPQEVVRLLNAYFQPMVRVVFKHGGTLEKYIGDALLAVWGAPVPWEDAADRALEAAVDMQRTVIDINRQWQEEDRPKIDIHIGIHTGRVAAGYIGSDEYIQYACIGDTTNVSSRICSVAEAGEILISAATRAKLHQDGFPFEQLSPVTIKGKEKPLELYRVDWAGNRSQNRRHSM